MDDKVLSYKKYLECRVALIVPGFILWARFYKTIAKRDNGV